MKPIKLLYLLALSPVLLVTCGCSKSADPVPPPTPVVQIDWNAAADSSSRSLVNSFWNAGGQYFNTDNASNTTFQYWPNGHALDVLVDAYTRSKDAFYKNYIDQWYAGVNAKNGNTFRNDYNDDMEWNALAMLRAYQATNDARYKDAALQVWEWIKLGWNTNAGGGIAWAKGYEFSKNACSNGPACILAARLYQAFGDEDNKTWAIKIYDWEKTTLFNSATGAVYDNINSNTGAISNWIFTYNQGTFVGSAVELYKITGDKGYLNDAVLASNYTISTLVTNSILKDEGNGDGGLFKGVFVRYFAELIQQNGLDASTKNSYIQFIKHNAETLWLQGATKQPAVLYGTNWGVKPGYPVGVTEQLSGSMLIEAMALLVKLSIITAS